MATKDLVFDLEALVRAGRVLTPLRTGSYADTIPFPLLNSLLWAGDESAWTLEVLAAVCLYSFYHNAVHESASQDWEWDSAAFTAKQVHRAGSPEPCCGVKRQRSGLLACEGLQAIQLLQHGQSSPLATTSGCSTEEEPFNAPLGSLLGVCCTYMLADRLHFQTLMSIKSGRRTYCRQCRQGRRKTARRAARRPAVPGT